MAKRKFAFRDVGTCINPYHYPVSANTYIYAEVNTCCGPDGRWRGAYSFQTTMGGEGHPICGDTDPSFPSESDARLHAVIACYERLGLRSESLKPKGRKMALELREKIRGILAEPCDE